MKKEDKIKTIRRMTAEVASESLYSGGFNELDQSELEFVHKTLLQYVSHEGLNKYMDFLESVSRSGVSRKQQMSDEEMEQRLTARLMR